MNKFGKVSIVSASLTLPLTLLTSGIVAWYLKSSNPDGVDITYALAYLRPTLLTAIACFVTLSLISLVSGILGLKKDDSKEYSKLGLLIIVLVAVFSFSAGIISKKTSDAESNYQKDSVVVE
ncbi:hypothetical protein H6800_03330 [Candidatus Nomurabacteria bacterium]|nr:hypothetical protein [Candidatus Nomurabacteria bacterium]